MFGRFFLSQYRAPSIALCCTFDLFYMTMTTHMNNILQYMLHISYVSCIWVCSEFTVWMHNNHSYVTRYDTNTLFAISSALFTLQSASESHLFSYKYHIWNVCIIPHHSIAFNQIRMKSEMLHVTFVIFVDFGHMPYIQMTFLLVHPEQISSRLLVMFPISFFCVSYSISRLMQ